MRYERETGRCFYRFCLFPLCPSFTRISVLGHIGLKAYTTDSDGNTVANPRFYRKAESKLKRLQRRHSRKQKQSSNRKKAQRQLAKRYLKVQRQREDFARKQANALVSSRDLIAFEDLKIRTMVKNKHLSKSIHDAGWGIFLNWVKIYGTMHDIPIIAVAPQFTSQDCSGCHTRVKKSLSVRTHICPSCGLILDRDENAARNILEKAVSTVGHTETGTRNPLKQSETPLLWLALSRSSD